MGDTGENAAAFGYAGTAAGDPDRPAFPKVRVVSISECGSHAVVGAEMGGVAGKGAGEQALARRLYARLDPGWLLIADRNFYNWQDWCAVAGSGAALLWRVKADLRLPLIEALPDGSYVSVVMDPKITGKARDRLIEAAKAGRDLDPARARLVRVLEYEIPDREGGGTGELIALITTIISPAQAPAAALAEAYQQRWELPRAAQVGFEVVVSGLVGVQPPVVVPGGSARRPRHPVPGQLAQPGAAASPTRRPGWPAPAPGSRPPGRGLDDRRFLEPQQAVAAAAAGEVEVIDSRRLGGAWVLGQLWEWLEIGCLTRV